MKAMKKNLAETVKFLENYEKQVNKLLKTFFEEEKKNFFHPIKNNFPARQARLSPASVRQVYLSAWKNFVFVVASV